MDVYNDAFNVLAQEQMEEDGIFSFVFPINVENKIGIQGLVVDISKYFLLQKYTPSDGTCLHAAYLASLFLLKSGIKHTVTTGNYYINDKLQYNANLMMINECMDKGFILEEPAKGHTWITLIDGTIIDFTMKNVESNYCYVENNGSGSLIDTSIGIRHRFMKKVKYIPMLVGPEYLIKTGFDLNDKFERVLSEEYVRCIREFSSGC